MNRLWIAFQQTSILFKLGFVVVVVVVLAVVGGGVGGFVSHYKDAKLDRIQAEREAEIDTISTERNEAIGRAEVWEKRAKDLEAEVAIKEEIIAASGAKAAAAQKAVDDETKKLDEEMDSINADADPAVRLEGIKERLRRLAAKM